MTFWIPLHATQFTAKAVHTKNGKQTRIEQVYVAEDLVRIETPMGKSVKIIILRPDLKALIELNPAKQSYREMPYLPGTSWVNFHVAMKDILTSRGEENISGQVCERLEAPGGMASFWISRKLNFPVRTIMSGETVELKDIILKEIDDAMFVPPRGYTLEFSMFAMQNGKPIFKPSDGSQPPSPIVAAPAGDKPHLQKAPSTAQPATLYVLPDPGERLPDPVLRIQTLPVDGGQLPDPEHPLVVLFSQPVFANHFSFSVTPDPGGWDVHWDKGAQRVFLHHEKPLDSRTSYTLKISMLGEPDILATFSVKALDGAMRLERDLVRGRIDIDQATRHRLRQIFSPAKVPEQYRLQKQGPSGTWNMLQVVRAFERLSPDAQKEIKPYLLPPNNPDSAYYKRLQKRAGRTAPGSRFQLIPHAWADDSNVIKAVYKTGTGYEVIVWGDKGQEKVVNKARDLIARYRMYERFERLMGRKTLDYGDHSLNIYIFPELKDEEEKVDGQIENYEPAGLCLPDKFLNSSVSPMKGAAATILISERQCTTERELGSTLAHEMFHAFQFAFTICGQKWLWEGSAVWAENFIDPAWNTEQEYLDDTFNDQLKAIKALTDVSSDINAYAMYLFPLYMTKINPGYDDIIRRIWEGNGCGVSSVQAAKSALGDFEAHWKTYALATLDEMPENGQFPDMDNEYGDGPLTLDHRHQHTEFKIDEEGYGEAAFGLSHLGASYIKAVNENKGPNAPAVSFDLRRFHGNNQNTVQAIIKYRDGRREYEDWSDMPERIFCLSHEDQNFAEIYIVVACAEEKEREETAETIGVVPALDNDCYRGSVSMTWRLQGNKNMQRRMGSHSQHSESSTSSWSRSATVRMDIKPWREDIPPQLSQALSQMETMFPDVKKENIEKGRRAAKSAVRAPVTSEDPHTGCIVHKYRVTACSVSSANGRKRTKSDEIRNDAMGKIKSCTTDYSENAYATGLDDNTQERLSDRDLQVKVYIDPASGKIKWVNVPSIGVDLQVNRNAQKPCTKRYQNRDSGTYYYKDEDFSWNDTKESDIILTFDSDSEDRKGQPMDPVWKAQRGSETSASGKGRKERPLDHKWNEATDKGEISGKEIEELTWSLNLEAVNTD